MNVRKCVCVWAGGEGELTVTTADFEMGGVEAGSGEDQKSGLSRLDFWINDAS